MKSDPFGFTGEATLQASDNFKPLDNPWALYDKDFVGKDGKLYRNLVIEVY